MEFCVELLFCLETLMLLLTSLILLSAYMILLCTVVFVIIIISHYNHPPIPRIPSSHLLSSPRVPGSPAPRLPGCSAHRLLCNRVSIFVVLLESFQRHTLLSTLLCQHSNIYLHPRQSITLTTTLNMHECH